MTNRSVLGGLLALSLAAAHSTTLAWEPPPQTSARDVLLGARNDAQEGRLAAAAEKHLWFHEHVLEWEPAMSGVRMSFALSDWAALAHRYPPAMAQMLGARDKALAQIDAGGRPGQRALSEVIHINNYLGSQDESTRDAFVRLVGRDPVMAEGELPDALPALIRLNEFALASRHLHIDTAVGRVESTYKALQEAPLPKLSASERADLMRSQQRVIDVLLARVVLVLSRDRRDAEASRGGARGRARPGPAPSYNNMTPALRAPGPPEDGAV